jgi:hypothetical protein
MRVTAKSANHRIQFYIELSSFMRRKILTDNISSIKKRFADHSLIYDFMASFQPASRATVSLSHTIKKNQDTYSVFRADLAW